MGLSQSKWNDIDGTLKKKNKILSKFIFYIKFLSFYHKQKNKKSHQYISKNHVDKYSNTDVLQIPKLPPTTSLTPSRLQISTRVVYGNVWETYTYCNKKIGSGICGNVLLGKKYNRNYAIKTYTKNKFNPIWYYNEANIYLSLDHPHVARLMEIYEDENNFSLVMEYCAGGELFENLMRQNSYSETDSRNVTLQMLSALQYLHTHSIVHRDLKLENWVYTSNDKYSLKLIDFGFSRIWNQHNPNMNQFCGTNLYISPDVVVGNYTNACDLWSLGIIVFMLLTGKSPFKIVSENRTNKLKDFEISSEKLNYYIKSDLARDFIANLLVIDPTRRLTTIQALNHPWILSIPSNPPQIDLFVVLSMKRFARASIFKQAVLLVMAMWLNHDDLDGMRDIFLEFDKMKNGTILLSELIYSLREKSNLSLDEIRTIFKSMDNSGNYEIYYTEFLAAMLDYRLKFCDELVRNAFEKFDIDHSGYVSLDNLYQVLGEVYMGVNTAEIIKEFDKTGNGMLNYEEFVLAVTTDNFTEASVLKQK